MAAQLAPLSASVTRILSLTGFPKELKTKDIQAAFSDWESASGGFRIKWIDDTSLLIVFNDAGVGGCRCLRVHARLAKDADVDTSAPFPQRSALIYRLCASRRLRFSTRTLVQ